MIDRNGRDIRHAESSDSVVRAGMLDISEVSVATLTGVCTVSHDNDIQ